MQFLYVWVLRGAEGAPGGPELDHDSFAFQSGRAQHATVDQGDVGPDDAISDLGGWRRLRQEQGRQRREAGAPLPDRQQHDRPAKKGRRNPTPPVFIRHSPATG
jgi:hypothetical protein